MEKKKIRERSYDFAVRMIKFVNSLPKNAINSIIGKQVLSSGTSIGANVEEAEGAFSKDEFTYKMSISFKEAKETNYWLRLIKGSTMVNSQELDFLIQESEELTKILASIVKSSKQK